MSDSMRPSAYQSLERAKAERMGSYAPLRHLQQCTESCMPAMRWPQERIISFVSGL